jgi:alpha-maltose-1-phosphate synthase
MENQLKTLFFMIKVLLTHPGTQYSFQLARQLQKIGYLTKFKTGFAYTTNSVIYKCLQYLPKTISKKLANRHLYNFSDKYLANSYLIEFLFPAYKKLHKKKQESQLFIEKNKIFQKYISGTIIKEVDVVIGFDTASFLLINKTHRLQKKFILDVSIAHSKTKEKVFKNLRVQYPNWAFSIEEKPQKVLELEQYELDNADAIVVASTFTKESLIENNVPSNKIFVNPYGIDTNLFVPKQLSVNTENNNINFLFVGLVDVRKGMPLLLSVWEKITTLYDAHLTIVGPISKAVENLIINLGLKNVRIVGKVPHHQMPEYFQKADIFSNGMWCASYNIKRYSRYRYY